MPVLQPSEYDGAYFDPSTADISGSTANSIAAGYGSYQRWNRIDGNDPESQGEHFKDLARKFFNERTLSGKDILEIGCAKGFMVEDLRDLGANAIGIDVSAYAIGEASAEVAPFVSVANALTDLTSYSRNQFDVVYTRRFLECIDDVDLPDLISEMNRISRLQIHWIGTQENAEFYNVKTLADWQAMAFQKKTILINHNNLNEILIK